MKGKGKAGGRKEIRGGERERGRKGGKVKDLGKKEGRRELIRKGIRLEVMDEWEKKEERDREEGKEKVKKKQVLHKGKDRI